MSIHDYRNVALIGHGGTGKTTLAETLLAQAGAIPRIGRIEDGSTVMDSEPEEQKHSFSICASLASYVRNGVKVNLIDTPGYPDFSGEVVTALHIADSAVLVVSALAGVETQTESAWALADKRSLPRMVIVNKMDRENADFDAAYQSVVNRFGNHCVASELPIGSADAFTGVVDLAFAHAYTYADGRAKEIPIPPEMAEQVATARSRLMDCVAETDESLMEKYLEDKELSATEIRDGLKSAVLAGALVPVMCGSAVKGIGMDRLEEALEEWLPAPDDPTASTVVHMEDGGELPVAGSDGPPVAYIFKTLVDSYVGKLSLFRVYSGVVRQDATLFDADLGKAERFGQLYTIFGKRHDPVGSIEAGDIGAVGKLVDLHTGDTICTKEGVVKLARPTYPHPVFRMAVSAASKGDEEKLGVSLKRICEEDPTTAFERDPETQQSILSGLGDLHLEVMLDRLRRKMGVEAVTQLPRISYKESIRGSAKAQGRYKKQTGGRGQFGDCWIEVEPLPRGEGFLFVDRIFGGSIPNNFRPAVEKGIRETMEEGILAGCTFVDVKVTLVDGSYHSVDSSEMAFKIAGSMAFRKAVEEAGGLLLEPVMKLRIQVPDALVGDVMGDLNTRRGRVGGIEPSDDGTDSIEALVPLAELQRYAIELRSITAGRGTFSMEHDHYEEVPAEVYTRIVVEHEASRVH